ncbi:MAG TPA: ABC transporter ATP-binding protein [Oceanospirillaceae bacterium]|jgi:branched-chain amino acid transport system ATP-binding protein|nr:ABC transporter ATP-binding protein [Oceanospirillaceae bacterium]
MPNPIIEITDLNKRFGAIQATHDLNLTLNVGEIHALIGPNGAGKSTLIKQITGYLQPDQGEIQFLGQTITQMSPASRARMGLAQTFQVSSLIMEYSCLDNVLLVVQARSGSSFSFFVAVRDDANLIQQAQDFLQQVGLSDRQHLRASALSHGERRQLEIAMALALEPKAFLLDEPMAGMDPAGVKQLIESLKTMREQAPILLIEHDMAAVFELADRITVLDYGRVIASGDVESIRNNKQVQVAYLGVAS